MKVELNEAQVKQICSILANVTVKVSEAPQVMMLIKALQTSTKEEGGDGK